jgi:hypothetical protein
MKTNREIFRDFHKAIELEYPEIEKYQQEEVVYIRSPIRFNYNIIRKPLKYWNQKDFNDAKRTIAFIKKKNNIRSF